MDARALAAEVRIARLLAVPLVRQRLGQRYAAHVRRDPLARIGVRPWSADPYAVYEQMRAVGPLVPSAMLPGLFGSVDHAVCKEVLRSRTFGTTDRERVLGSRSEEFDMSLLELDPPDHTRLRRVCAPAFTPRRMAGYATTIEKRVHELLDHVDPQTPFDLQTVLSRPLPIGVISDLLGIGDADAPTFTAYGKALAGALDGIQSLRHAHEAFRAKKALEGMFTRLLEQRRAEPREDMLSILAAATDGGEDERIQPHEVLPLCQLLLVAGFETTVNLIGNAAHHLLRQPEVWRRLADDPTLAGAVVEETLRYDSPVQMTSRVAHEPVELAGRALPAGTWVVTYLGGANRDPAVYDRPAVFDLDRTDAGDYLSFSAGIHYCLGAPLAKLEAETALRVLAERLPRLRLAGTVPMASTVVLRGVAELPVVAA